MKKHVTITINIGNGVTLEAPFKKNWSLDEWRRMVCFIEERTATINTLDEK